MAHMRLQRIIVVTVLLIAAAVALWMGLTVHWGMEQPKPQDFARLVKAMQEFSRDRAAAGEAPPVSVSVPELVNSGYLAALDARVFADMDVSLKLSGDLNQAGSILIEVRLPDGSVIAQTADGAVQQLKK